MEELRKELDAFKANDQHLSENGRLFAYVYTSEGPRFELQVIADLCYFSTFLLAVFLYRTLGSSFCFVMKTELVSMFRKQRI